MFLQPGLRRTIVRVGSFIFSGLLLIPIVLIPIVGQAQTSLQSFTWERNARFELQITQKNRPVTIKGDLRDGARQSFQSKDLQTTAEFKSFTSELFVVVAITSEGDDTGYIFLLERPVESWLVMNRQAIPSRKVDIMNDFETALKDFKSTTDHTFANILRKMAEYFAQNPNKRLQDLLSALENRDESLRTIPIPRGGPRSGNQGVIPGRSPLSPAPVQTPSNRDLFGDEVAPTRPRRLAPEDFDRSAPRPPGYIGENDPALEQDREYAARERARQRRLREQRRLEQAPPQYDRFGNPYPTPRRDNPYYPSDRPVDLRPPPRPQYAPPQYAPPARPRGFFESLFGG
jgi:hypothetical protein